MARSQEPARGPGDPTTVLATGLDRPCRIAFDRQGNLFVAEISAREIRKVTSGGTVTLFNSGLADYRGIAFDVFGDILLTDAGDDVVHRISPQGTVSRFANVQEPWSAPAIAPDGDVWVPTWLYLHHFTPLGELVESLATGFTGMGMHFSPAGEIYLSSWGSTWKFQGGVATPILTQMTPRNWGMTFDVASNVFQAHEAMDGGDTHRIIVRSISGALINDTLAKGVVGPCATAFATDATGATTNQLVIAQTNGTILRANPAGTSSPGHPMTPLSLVAMTADRQMGALAGNASALTSNEARFLDAIGNRNGSHDVGDFRAYLIATGAIPSPVAGLTGAAALAALHGVNR
jgi:hypothetical protein